MKQQREFDNWQPAQQFAYWLHCEAGTDRYAGRPAATDIKHIVAWDDGKPEPVTDVSADALSLLADAVVCYGWIIKAAEIRTAIQLVDLGLGQIEDRYEGPQLRATEKGVALAIERGVVTEDQGYHYGPTRQKAEAVTAPTK